MWKLIPGARKMGLNNININPKDFAHIEAIILSMTSYERRHPEVLKASRKIRIAKGSGMKVEDVKVSKNNTISLSDRILEYYNLRESVRLIKDKKHIKILKKEN